VNVTYGVLDDNGQHNVGSRWVWLASEQMLEAIESGLC
jgi:hypothetical protein